LVACRIEPLDEQLHNLSRYHDWLATEGVSAGGIAPRDVDRIGDRHIGDSLLFLRLLPRSGDILDIGSGVGLPGIPLAIALPNQEIVCLDRSGRRVDLLNRASRVLELENMTVIQSDIHIHTDRHFSVVSRATIPPAQFRPILSRVLAPDGIAVVGGSWIEEPTHPGYRTEEIGLEILGHPVWVLIMTTK
jgi:16S rRNA (guanine527-N7)-methyltransferase